MYFRAGIWKYYCHVSNQRPQICLVAMLSAKVKILKFRTKNALFGYFWAGILKIYCHIWNQHLRTSLITKFCEGTKMPKFETENTLFEYFWPKMHYLGTLRQGFKKILLSNLESASSNLSICKISRKNKNA